MCSYKEKPADRFVKVLLHNIARLKEYINIFSSSKYQLRITYLDRNLYHSLEFLAGCDQDYELTGETLNKKSYRYVMEQIL